MMFDWSGAIGHKLTSVPGDAAHRAAAVCFNTVGCLENCKTDIQKGEREVKRKLDRGRESEAEKWREMVRGGG